MRTRHRKETRLKTVVRYLVFRSIELMSILAQRYSRHGGEKPAHIRSILVVDLALLGDLLLSTPLLAGIKKCIPDAAITVVCTPWSAEAVKLNPSVDHIHTYDAFWEDRTANPGCRHLRSTVRLLHFFRKQQFDVAFVLNMRPQPLVSCIGYFSGAKTRIGLKYETGSRFLTHALEDRGDHIVAAKLHLLTVLCANREYSTRLVYRVSEESDSIAAAYLQQCFGSQDKQFVCITPSTLQKAKQWKSERWISLVERLNNDGFAVILGGGRDDRGYIEEIFAGIADHALNQNAAGSLSFNQYAAILKRAAGLITVESAPMHLAAALYTPAVIMFSSVYDFARFIPVNDRQIVLHREVPCSMCAKGCDEATCMDYSVAEVYSAFRSLVSAKEDER